MGAIHGGVLGPKFSFQVLFLEDFPLKKDQFVHGLYEMSKIVKNVYLFHQKLYFSSLFL